MPKREKLIQDMQAEHAQAVILLAQVGAAPGELQVILQTAVYDEPQQGLRPRGSYIIRVLGAMEYRIASMGLTVDHVEFLDEHPLLYVYNHPAAALFFKGIPPDVNALVIDLLQAHASTLGPWRPFPEYLNVSKPLVDLFSSGGGLAGQMPEPLAEALAKILEKHGLESKLLKGQAPQERHDNPILRQQQTKILMIGESYFIANLFSVEEMGKT